MFGGSRCQSLMLLLVALVCVFQGFAFGQGFASVTGSVTDPSGAVIPGVDVSVTNSATGVTRQVITNENGIYAVTQLAPGTYAVRAELPGFRAKVVNGVVLPVDATVTLNLPLEVGAVTDVVNVLASVEAINTVDAKLGVGFDERRIIDLPLNARNIVSLLSLQSGVTVSEKRNEFDRDDGGQVNGARNDQQNIVLDGVNINAQERGAPLEGALPTTVDSVQEFLVSTASQGASGARSSGAQVQLVTKSGSNEWHGSAYEFYRTTGTSARNYFAKEPQQLIRHLPGGSLGGPAIKDKFFFFGAYERHTDRSTTLRARNIPTTQFLNGVVRYLRKDGTFGVLTDGPGGGLEKFSLIPGDRWNSAMIGPNGMLEAFRPFSSDATRTTAGLDGGANILTYRFNAPFIRNRNIYISRLDYTVSPAHTVYLRGTINDDARTLEGETLPGFNNARLRLDNSRGFATNWNWVMSPQLNSNLTAGLTRESFEDTGNNRPYFNYSAFDKLFNTAGAQRQAINTWNLVESVSWLKGNHNVQAGFNFRYIDNYLRSFAAVQPSNYSGSAILTANQIGKTQSPGLQRALSDEEYNRVADPAVVGEVVMTATGSVCCFSEDVQFDLNGRKLPAGAPFERNFRLQEYDYYLQDTWRLRSNLTVSYGMTYSLQTPPYEARGYQVNWTENLGRRLKEQADTTKTVMDLPLYTTQLLGRANGLPDYYPMDTNNWAPRVSLAWTPSFASGLLGAIARKGGQMVVRGGYSLMYDRVGGRFARDAAETGSVGLKTLFSTPTFGRSFDGLSTAPRAPRVGPGGVLPRGEFPVAGDASFLLPLSPGGAGGVSTSGIDSGMHSPTNNLFNLTISKELPGGWVIEASYVGRFARGLVGQVDLASMVNIRDPKSGMTFFDASGKLFRDFMFQSVPVENITPIAWFENIYPQIQQVAEARFNRKFNSATQAFYYSLLQGGRPGPNFQVNYSGEIQELEIRSKALANPVPNKLLSPQVQFFGLFSNIGLSNYNSGQFSARKRFSQGYSFTANYTWSRSMDITSSAEARGNRPDGQTGEGLAADPYHPEFSYARSDFDRRHQFNANFLAELPFGRGKLFGRDASGVLNHVIGGWQIQGIAVASSGRPWNFTSSSRFIHHFFGRAQPHVVKPIPWKLTKTNGRVFLIGDSAQGRRQIALENFENTVPGGPVARNLGLGPNFFNVDFGLMKNFNLTEKVRARLRWETFNALNHPNFDFPTDTGGNSIDRLTGTLGEVRSTVGTERVMQFSFRLEF